MRLVIECRAPALPHWLWGEDAQRGTDLFAVQHRWRSGRKARGSGLGAAGPAISAISARYQRDIYTMCDRGPRGARPAPERRGEHGLPQAAARCGPRVLVANATTPWPADQAFLAFLATGFGAATLAALRAAAFGSTAALKAVPGVNFGSFTAAILILAPVLGFTPLRAARECCLKEPKPGIVTAPPFLTVVTITSSTDSRMRPDSAFENSCVAAKCSINSALFIRLFLNALANCEPRDCDGCLTHPRK